MCKHPKKLTDKSAPDADPPVTHLTPTYPAHHHVEKHQHERAQLLYAVQGLMVVTTDQGSWSVPPQQAVWIPPDLIHQVSMPCDVVMHSLYIRRDIAGEHFTDCRVVEVTPLLRELIARLVTINQNNTPQLERLMSVLLDEIKQLESPPLYLPAPQDSRLRSITETLTANPANDTELQQWAKTVGASSRTLSRLFERETGMSFSSWRQQLRLLTAIERLTSGQSVTTVALELGYQSPSAFIAMFRRTLGSPPGKYTKSA
ncbi:hypothetical protein AB833_21625 [Chromatiales bacterium (ex Bugula neritina AB1)]|nr:hypothetical protein AB833_21625 [Chromatiales bacterium (ex Bugula neritina AB1)]